MTAALVQGIGTFNSGGADDNTIVLSVTKTVAEGNTIVVAAARGGALGLTTCTDNLGNTYSKVEGTIGSVHGSALFVAPVTTGGSLTTITASMTGFSVSRTLIAAEFSGVGSLSTVGGGTSATSGTGTWVTSKTIPAGGLAVGLVSPFGRFQTVGGASGTPSTTPVIQAQHNGDTNAVGLTLCYAIAGGSDVTGFSSTTTFTSDPWVSNGAVYSPAVTGPVWVSPADTTSMGSTPVLVFTSPTSASAQHFELQLDTANTFDTGNLRDLRTDASQTGWEYDAGGGSWTAFPSGGLASGFSGNDVRHTVQSALSTTTWYRRVRAGV